MSCGSGQTGSHRQLQHGSAERPVFCWRQQPQGVCHSSSLRMPLNPVSMLAVAVLPYIRALEMSSLGPTNHAPSLPSPSLTGPALSSTTASPMSTFPPLRISRAVSVQMTALNASSHFPSLSAASHYNPVTAQPHSSAQGP